MTRRVPGSKMQDLTSRFLGAILDDLRREPPDHGGPQPTLDAPRGGYCSGTVTADVITMRRRRYDALDGPLADGPGLRAERLTGYDGPLMNLQEFWVAVRASLAHRRLRRRWMLDRRWSYQDQLSLPYLLWKLRIEPAVDSLRPLGQPAVRAFVPHASDL